MAISRTQLLRILTRNHLRRTTGSYRSRSDDGKERGVDVSEISALKDFVEDSIVRGSSLLLPEQCNRCTDYTDIHQRHFLKYRDLRNKELKQALLIYDQSTDVNDFVERYRSSPTLSVAGVIATPDVLYHKVAEVKRLMSLGLKPMESLKALRHLQEGTIRKRLPILKELGGDVHLADNIGHNMYKAVVGSSLHYARKNKLIGDKDVIQTLVDQLPLPEYLKGKLTEMSHAACGGHLQAMSGSEVKIVILNEYLNMTLPQHKFKPVTEDEFGRLMYFRLQDAVQVVDIIRNDENCMKNLSRISFGSLTERLTPEDLKKLLQELPVIGDTHISAVFFHKRISFAFVHGPDKFIERYKFLKREGFTDQEIVKRPDILLLADKTRDQRLEYWYTAFGKRNVVLSNMGMKLLRNHNKATYRYEIMNGKKVVPVHYVLRECKSNRRDTVITGYLHEFCNKFAIDADTFADKMYSSTHFVTESFDLSNFYNVYHFLIEQNVCKEQLENSPYILVTKFAKVRQVFDKMSSDGQLDKWIRHPLLLDMVVYLCHADEKTIHTPALVQQSVSSHKESGSGDATSAAADPITSPAPKSGAEFVVHDQSHADSILYDGESPPLSSMLQRRERHVIKCK